MLSTLWAEDIERALPDERTRMSFSPYYVEPDGHLSLFLESIYRTPKPGADVPLPWPVGRAPGWKQLPIDDEWSMYLWCALGGEWILQPSDSSRPRPVILSDHLTHEAQARIRGRLHEPLELLNSGKAFAFCGSLFILPDNPFVMNSFTFHPEGREPLDIFVGFRGHTKPYPEVITPGIFREVNHPTKEKGSLYERKARVACNVAKQIMYEAEA